VYSIAEKRAMTNPNLLRIILSFTGMEIKRECNICGRIINYQILNQEVVRDHKSYINLETCKKIYFCSDDCLYIYNKRFNNKRFCIYLFLILIFLHQHLYFWFNSDFIRKRTNISNKILSV
jgi:predicted nucleic acid-binding Zn ribbon protein